MTPPELTSPEDYARYISEQMAKQGELAKLGLSVRTSSPEQLGAMVKSDISRWKQVVAKAGVTAD